MTRLLKYTFCDVIDDMRRINFATLTPVSRSPPFFNIIISIIFHVNEWKWKRRRVWWDSFGSNYNRWIIMAHKWLNHDHYYFINHRNAFSLSLCVGFSRKVNYVVEWSEGRKKILCFLLLFCAHLCVKCNEEKLLFYNWLFDD